MTKFPPCWYCCGLERGEWVWITEGCYNWLDLLKFPDYDGRDWLIDQITPHCSYVSRYFKWPKEFFIPRNQLDMNGFWWNECPRCTLVHQRNFFQVLETGIQIYISWCTWTIFGELQILTPCDYYYENRPIRSVECIHKILLTWNSKFFGPRTVTFVRNSFCFMEEYGLHKLF